MRATIYAPTPVWPNAPTSNAFTPLVMLIAVLVPAIDAWYYGRLSADQAAAGLRGLDVLMGNWWQPGAGELAAPPLFSWCNALAQSLFWAEGFRPLIVASYAFGLASVILLFAVGRHWFSRATGLLACLLFVLNPIFLEQVRQGDDSVCVLCWSLLILWAYARHLRTEADLRSRWTIILAAGFFPLILSCGLFSLWILAIVVVHQCIDRIERRMTFRGNLARLTESSHLQSVGVAYAAAAALASAWLLTAPRYLSSYFPWPTGVIEESARISWSNAMLAMPATFVLSLFGIVTIVRDFWHDRPDSNRAILSVIWGALSAIAANLSHQLPAAVLLAVAPLTLIAVRVLFGILQRDIRDRMVVLLIGASTAAFIVSQSPILRQFPRRMISGPPLDYRELWNLHLGFDLLILSSILILWLYRQTSRHDRYRRMLFGGFVLAMILLACLQWIVRVERYFGTSTGAAWRFQRVQRKDDPWLRVFQALKQHQTADIVVLLGPNPPSLELEYVVRKLFLHAERRFARDRREIDAVLQGGGRRPLVIVTDRIAKLELTLPVARRDETLTLSRVFDSDLLAAYAPSAP